MPKTRPADGIALLCTGRAVEGDRIISIQSEKVYVHTDRVDRLAVSDVETVEFGLRIGLVEIVFIDRNELGSEGLGIPAVGIEDRRETVPVAIGVAPGQRADQALFTKGQALSAAAESKRSAIERDIDIEEALVEVECVYIRVAQAAGQITVGAFSVDSFHENTHELRNVQIAVQQEVVEEVGCIEPFCEGEIREMFESSADAAPNAQPDGAVVIERDELDRIEGIAGQIAIATAQARPIFFPPRHRVVHGALEGRLLGLWFVGGHLRGLHLSGDGSIGGLKGQRAEAKDRSR